jgi:hypothetical protein
MFSTKHIAQISYFKVEITTFADYTDIIPEFFIELNDSLNEQNKYEFNNNHLELLKIINDNDKRIYYDRSRSIYYDDTIINHICQELLMKYEYDNYKIEIFLCKGYINYEKRKYQQLLNIAYFITDQNIIKYQTKRLPLNFSINFVNGLIQPTPETKANKNLPCTESY